MDADICVILSGVMGSFQDVQKHLATHSQRCLLDRIDPYIKSTTDKDNYIYYHFAGSVLSTFFYYKVICSRLNTSAMHFK